MKSTLAKIAVLLISCAVTPSRASADIVSYTTDIPFLNIAQSTEILLPLFDPALGTLTSVAFDLTGEGDVQFEVLDDFGDGGVAVAFMFGEFTALVGAGPIGNTFELLGEEGYDEPGSYNAFVSGGTGDFSSDPDTLDLFVASVIGEMFGTEVVFDGVDVFSDEGDDIFSTDGFFFAGQITVTYEFTPVPEPGSLLIPGLMSLAIFRTRRRN